MEDFKSLTFLYPEFKEVEYVQNAGTSETQFHFFIYFTFILPFHIRNLYFKEMLWMAAPT